MVYINDNLSSITPQQLDQLIASLPDWRREQALRFKFPQGRLECALSYSMLCDALKKEYGIHTPPTFVIGEHGKPSLLEYPDIHFNLSHCKCAIAVAVSDSPVGIDIERIGRENDSLARHVLNDSEYTQMHSSEKPSVKFAEFWTQKEALVKLIGTGITDDLKIILPPSDGIKIDTHVNEEKGYVYSIACAEQGAFFSTRSSSFLLVKS